jgi:tetratricopeptide (TPR) repeat protein
MEVRRISYFGVRQILFYTGLSLLIIGAMWLAMVEQAGSAWVLIALGIVSLISLIRWYPEILWIHHHNAGTGAYEHKKYEKAELHYRKAAHYAEKFGPNDNRIGQDLDYLGTVYHSQKRDRDAQQLYQKAFDVYAHTTGPGPDHKAAVQHDMDLLYAEIHKTSGGTDRDTRRH